MTTLMNDLDKVNADIRIALERKAKIEAALKALDSAGPAARLAIILYTKFGLVSDRDGAWFYEMRDEFTHDWGGFMHNIYLRKAMNILQMLNTEGKIDASNVGHFIEKYL